MYMLARRTLWCETEETVWFGQGSEWSRSSEALLVHVHVVNASRDNRLRRRVIACVFIRRIDKKVSEGETLRLADGLAKEGWRLTRSAGAIGRRLLGGIERQLKPQGDSLVQQHLSIRGKAILFLADGVSGPSLLSRARNRRQEIDKRLDDSEQEPHRPPVSTDVVVDDDDGLQKSEGHCGRSSSLQYRLRLVARFILSCALPCLALASLHVGLPKKKLPLFFSQSTSPVDSSTRRCHLVRVSLRTTLH
ncbi:hypothetical protein KCU61_g724, partial [Aureobasidium melanogenum]